MKHKSVKKVQQLECRTSLNVVFLNFEDKILFSISLFFRADSPPANASGVLYWVFEIQVELD